MDAVSKRANFDKGALDWQFVYAYWHALFSVRDNGSFNMCVEPDVSSVGEWVLEMAKAFSEATGLEGHGVVGDLKFVCERWYADCDAAERDYERVRSSAAILPLQKALEVMDQRGGVLWSQREGVLPVKRLAYPLEFLRCPDFDLRAVYDTWRAFTPKRKRDERGLERAFPDLPFHTVLLLFKTLKNHETDVARQVAIAPFDYR